MQTTNGSKMGFDFMTVLVILSVSVGPFERCTSSPLLLLFFFFCCLPPFLSSWKLFLGPALGSIPGDRGHPV